MGVTTCCSARSDEAVHGTTSKPHAGRMSEFDWRTMEHDPEGHERLQAHKRRRDVQLEVGANRAPVVREDEGDPALLERQDAEMPVEAPLESASVKRGQDAEADNEERARLRVRAEGKRGQKHDMQECWNPRPRRGPDWSRGGASVKAHNLSQNWRKR